MTSSRTTRACVTAAMACALACAPSSPPSTPIEGTSVLAPSLACEEGEPFTVRLAAETYGCFGGTGRLVEIDRFDGETWLQTTRWTRRLSAAEASQVLVAFEQTLAEPERLNGGFSTTRIEAELEVRCGTSFESARWDGYAIDAADLDDMGEHDGAVRARGTFAKPNALFRLADALVDAASMDGA